MAPRLLVFDLENSAASGDFWGAPYNTNIIRITRPSRVMSFAAKWYGEKKVHYHSDFHDGHDNMIGRAWELLDEADAVVSWNGKGHDSPHTMREILLAGATPPSPYREIDLYRVVKRRMKFQSNKLQFVADELGIGSKLDHEGYDLWVKCMAGDPKAWKRFRAYNVQDVLLTEVAFERLLPWIPPSMLPNRNLFGGQGCPTCGSGSFEKRGFRYTALAKIQRLRCLSCGAWFDDGRAVERVTLRGAAA